MCSRFFDVIENRRISDSGTFRNRIRRVSSKSNTRPTPARTTPLPETLNLKWAHSNPTSSFEVLFIVFSFSLSCGTRKKPEGREREEQWRAASPTLPACQSVCQSGTHVEFCNLLFERNSACLGCFLQLLGFVRGFIRTLLALYIKSALFLKQN